MEAVEVILLKTGYREEITLDGDDHAVNTYNLQTAASGTILEALAAADDTNVHALVKAKKRVT